MKAMTCYVSLYGVPTEVHVMYRIFFYLNFCSGVARPRPTGDMGEQYGQHGMDGLSKSAVIVVWTTLPSC